MRDSIPPFLGLFLGCPVVRSLSWCGRREEGRTRGADWHPTANLWQSLTMISPSHSFIVLFQPFPFEKNLEIHFFRLCFVKLKLLLLAIEVSQTILVRSSFLTEAKAPFVLRHSPFKFMNCNCSENHFFAITSFTLQTSFNCQVKPDDGSDTKISINPRRSKVKKLNKNQTSTRQCDTIFTLFSFNFHKIPPPAISTPIQCYVFAKVPANTIGFFIAQSAEEVKRWDFP